jgi:hypothetical protein
MHQANTPTVGSHPWSPTVSDETAWISVRGFFFVGSWKASNSLCRELDAPGAPSLGWCKNLPQDDMGGGDLTPKRLVFHGFSAKVDTLHRTLCRSLPKCWIFTLRSSWCAWHRPSKSRFRRHLSHLTKCGRVKYSHEATTLPGSSVSKTIRLACCVV